MYEESERTCSTCNKYCRYTNEVAEGKAQYDYKLILDCLKHGHFFWKKYLESPKENGKSET